MKYEIWWFVGLLLLVIDIQTGAFLAGGLSGIYAVHMLFRTFYMFDAFENTVGYYEELRSKPRWGTIWNRNGAQIV